MNRTHHVLLSVVCTLVMSWPAFAQTSSKPATDTTKAANAAVLNQLDFANQQDFEDARRGFIAPLQNNGVITNAKGEAMIDITAFKVPDGPGPEWYNPSLWRMAQLNSLAGLFQVVDRIY
jgi:alkyl sulfatase BDS1-like metallo-beta-lactamase superfamily hydrolase